MAAPTSPADLSATVASNGPDGATEQVSVLDDYIRGLSGAVKQLVVKGADIPSAATITPAATASFYDITGTTGITAIGSTNSWDGRIVWFQFDDAVTLTHSSTLKLPGAVNYTTAAGDVLAFVQETSGTWRCCGFIAADGLSAVSVPRSTTATTATVADVNKCIAVSAGITIPNSTFAAGDTLSIYNDSASSVTITAGVTTLRLAGTTSTGNRTLAARGLATVWFNSATEAIISGAGIS